ncbi:MAG: IS1595 family transposase [Chloroflexi bacterium]|nr:IS1595 family transposase [Chloroflexota bacterium]
MTQKAPGKSHREGISLLELTEMFPEAAAAVEGWEARRGPDGERHCGRCCSVNTQEVPNAKPMPYWCTDCRSYFSVRTGTMMESSRLPFRKWAFAVYLYVTNLKGVSSMKLHRDLGITQKSAWFMLHRLREAWDDTEVDLFTGPVEADETYMGGKRQNMPKSKRRGLTGRGAVGKAAIIGSKDRETNQVVARHIPNTGAQHTAGFVAEKTAPGATVYTDQARTYHALKSHYDHHSVNHSVGEYVKDQAHTNGIESFWAMLKRGHDGTYHKMSEKHLQRYVIEFARRHNIREADTLEQMSQIVAGMVGRRLMYSDLIA